ncbi:MAG: disulfide bond formation protein DsbA, partial [Bradyrhizobiaceae bacterium]|nr:disulfide bond formation protein DsbA [Bradyrhizobiaceae bacterium]
LERLAGDEDVDAVTAEARSFEMAGVNSVPYFIFGGIYAVAGAQEPDDLVDAMERTIAERAKRESAEMTQA